MYGNNVPNKATRRDLDALLTKACAIRGTQKEDSSVVIVDDDEENNSNQDEENLNDDGNVQQTPSKQV